MKGHSFLTFFLVMIVHTGLFAFEIGKYSVTFQDPARSNRNIPVDIYYPAVQAGEQSPFVSGEFPVVVFGHGFAMNVNAYQNIWEALVSIGYIVVLPKTEGSLIPAPSHNDFGLDISFLVSHLQQISSIPGSFFYQRVSDKTAIMGHSMGGGASFLAASGGNPDITTKITLAPAETDPSAIGSAEDIGIPSLVIAGKNDCVTPEADHQIPLYQALSSDCKYYVAIEGASHCQFANYNFNCWFGESTCSPSASISRNEQQQRLNLVMIPWLDYHLKGNCESWLEFDSIVHHTSFLSAQSSCNLTLPDAQFTIDGNIKFCTGDTVVLTAIAGSFIYEWSNGLTGQQVFIDDTQDVQLIKTDQAGCSDTSSVVSFEAYPLPEVNILQLNGLSTDCILDSLNLTIDNLYPTILWNDSIEQEDFTIFENQTVRVQVIDSNGCSLIVIDSFSLEDIPEVDLVQINDTLYSSEEGITYKWFLDEVFLEETNSPFLIAEAEGIYRVEVLFENGCTGVSNGIDYRFTQTTDLSATRFIFYHENERLYIEPANGLEKSYNLNIYTISGQLLKEKQAKEGNVSISTQNFPSGMYIARLMFANGEYVVKRFVK